MMNNSILESVSRYYTDKIRTHGASPAGVDWNSKESQEQRFKELCKVIKAEANFSVLDYGCGYGAMLDYLLSHYEHFSYTGLDISAEMLDSAESRHPNTGAVWKSFTEPGECYDYVIASGLFNVKQTIDSETWKRYIIETLDVINGLSVKGFAFNILTSYSDKEFMKDYLYYANPCFFFDHCKVSYSKQVSLLHDYNLYEFTIIVRK